MYTLNDFGLLVDPNKFVSYTIVANSCRGYVKFFFAY